MGENRAEAAKRKFDMMTSWTLHSQVGNKKARQRMTINDDDDDNRSGAYKLGAIRWCPSLSLSLTLSIVCAICEHFSSTNWYSNFFPSNRCSLRSVALSLTQAKSIAQHNERGREEALCRQSMLAKATIRKLHCICQCCCYDESSSSAFSNRPAPRLSVSPLSRQAHMWPALQTNCLFSSGGSHMALLRNLLC